ncbi:unnamed protein product [Bursaphelenchus xylophilus]|uniref:(pine wood nematode) hypothetical protein n=1 Tax=Bursaphelenchus xylophilus TaxID=6326 RepID=A0A1I7RKF3_BURXY|nr:unnamed protein product [Bursaphelenchus xylophilus]CAG9131353.1 unnamed protein product [Bursaphelenchus xylophilus]
MMDLSSIDKSEISTDLVVKKKGKPQNSTESPVALNDYGEKENQEVREDREVKIPKEMNDSDTVPTEKKDIIVDEVEEEILTSDSEPSEDEEADDADPEDEDDFLEDDLAEISAEEKAEVEGNEEGAMDVEEEVEEGSENAEDADAEDDEEFEEEEEEEEPREPTQEELEEAERRREQEELEYLEYEARLQCNLPSNIDHAMPLIFWHDRKQIMSVHCQPVHVPHQFHSDAAKASKIAFKICTASVQDEVRVWEITLNPKKDAEEEDPWHVNVTFIANLEGHAHPLNFAMYSPNGEFIASGDVSGTVIIWKIFPREEGFVLPEEPPMNDEKALFDIPVNKENWKRAFLPIRHEDEVNCAVFSPNSQFLCTASEENALRLLKCGNGKNVWKLTNFRRKITGVCWDPNGYYIVTLSTDQRMDIILAQKGHRLRTCHSIQLPDQILENDQIIRGMRYKFFFDQHTYAFTRTPQFTPCGELLITPAAQLENEDEAFYGVYVFRRCDFDTCLPYQMYRTARPTVMVSIMNKRLALRTEEEQEPFVDLPYRYVFAALCTESIYIFDTQYPQPIAYLTDLSYDNLTSLSWSIDGKVLCVSSLEGYNHFIHFRGDEFDNVTTDALQTCELPILKKPKEETTAKPGLEDMVRTDLPEGSEQKTPKGNQNKEEDDGTTPVGKTPKSRKKTKKENVVEGETATNPTTSSTPKPKSKENEGNLATPNAESSVNSTTTPKTKTPMTKAEEPNQKKIFDFFAKPGSQPSTPKSIGRRISTSRPTGSTSQENNEDLDIIEVDDEEEDNKQVTHTPKRKKPAPTRKAKTAATAAPSTGNLDSSSDDEDFKESSDSEDSEASQDYDSADEVSPVEVSSSEEMHPVPSSSVLPPGTPPTSNTPPHNIPHPYPATPQRPNPPPPLEPFTPQQMAEKKARLKEIYGKYAQKPLPPFALQSAYTVVPTNSSLNNDFLIVMPRLDVDSDAGAPQTVPQLGPTPNVRDSFVQKIRPRQ